MNRKDWSILTEIPIENYYNSFTFKINEFIEIYNTSSKGDQRKWTDLNGNLYIKEQLYDCNKYWCDNNVEVIASDILHQLNTEYKFADYYLCKILDYKNYVTEGCVSSNFLKANEELITLNRLIEMKGLKWKTYKSAKDVWEYLCNITFYLSGLDCKAYLSVLFLVDYLTLNTDRHLNNIDFIRNIKTRELSFSPMFDFGRGFSIPDDFLFNQSTDKIIEKTKLKPFGFKAEKIIDTILEDTDILSKLNTKLNTVNFEFSNFKQKVLFNKLCDKVGIKHD